MKNFRKKASLILMLVAVTIFSSCEKEDLTTFEKIEQESQNKSISVETEEACRDFSVPTSKAGCGALTHTACEFTGGCDSVFQRHQLMIDMLDNCKRESLPSNCSWWGNRTITKTFSVDISNCGTPAYALNATVNRWEQLAKDNKPRGYLITKYEKQNGYMVTRYGPYRLTIEVTYRQTLCMVVIDTDPGDLEIGFETMN